MPGVPHPPAPVRDRLAHGWATFKGWHGEPSLWREIYTRTLGTVSGGSFLALLALTLGVIPVPSRRAVLLTVAVLVVLALTGAAMAWLLIRLAVGRETQRIMGALAGNSDDYVQLEKRPWWWRR